MARLFHDGNHYSTEIIPEHAIWFNDYDNIISIQVWRSFRLIESPFFAALHLLVLHLIFQLRINIHLNMD